MNNNSKDSNVKTIDRIRAGLDRRYAAERRFRRLGQISVMLGFVFLGILLFSIVSKGYSAFLQTFVQLDIHYDETRIVTDGKTDADSLAAGDYAGIIKASLRKMYPDVKKRKDKRKLYKMVSSGAPFQLQNYVMQNPDVIGKKQTVWVPVDDDADMFFKGHISSIDRHAASKFLSLNVEGKRVVLNTDGEEFSDIHNLLKQHLESQYHDVEERHADKQELKDAMVVQSKQLQQQIDEHTHNGRYQEAEKVKEQLTDTEIYIDQYSSELQILNRELTEISDHLEFAGQRATLPVDMPSFLVSVNGGYIKLDEVGINQAAGQMLLSTTTDETATAENWDIIKLETPQTSRRVSDLQAAILLSLEDQGRIHKRFNTTLFTAGDSREPELAGIASALKGTMLMLIVTLVLSFPIGAATAIYLEEFAPQNRWTDFIEVNINNLAAVPSIIFGLLGLAIFINIGGLPRFAPLVGGMVLTLMTLPTIIIAGRAALKSVPPSIREAALGVGASRVQMIFFHVFPLAMPGMMTGTIIGMAQALGESAPLLMIGMVAFIVDIPQSFVDPATALPVQIYLWADSPERAFVERTSAAIMILLVFLVAMNACAVLLRKHFERRW